MSRRFPALKSIAAVTVLTFTITTLLPAGWSWAAPARDTMRVTAAAESSAESGLEEALTGMSRRNFLKAGTTVAAGLAVLGSSISRAAPTPAPTVPAASVTNTAIVSSTPAVDLPLRVSMADTTYGWRLTPAPPLVVSMEIKDESSENRTAPLKTTVTQTEVPQLLETPWHLARDPLKTAVARTGRSLADVQTWLRRRVLGTAEWTNWAAATGAREALLFPGIRTTYTLWHPEELRTLGDDQVAALFTALGAGAGNAKTHGVEFLYELQWPVKLTGADAERGSAPAEVLAQVRRHAALARHHQIGLRALYSGAGALGDPDEAVRLLRAMMDQGFWQLATDIEPWADPVWQQAALQVAEAKARGARDAMAAGRRELLRRARDWVQAHRAILQEVIPDDHAYPAALGGPPTVLALVDAEFVPRLKEAVFLEAVEQAAVAKGYVVDTIWEAFDEVSSRGDRWTPDQLQAALTARGLTFSDEEFAAIQARVRLPARLQFGVMAYAYRGDDSNDIAKQVADKMRTAYAGGFGGPLALVVNLEPGDPSISLAGRLGRRSAKAGEIVEQILETLRNDSTTGFDRKTLVVHVADGWGLADLAREGRLTAARAVTPRQMEEAGRIVGSAADRLFGKPPRRLEDRHRLPVPSTRQERWRELVQTTGWGLLSGVAGLGPLYANLVENPKAWAAGRAKLSQDTVVSGTEAGSAQKGLRLVVGALTSGQARVVDAHLRLTRRGRPPQKIPFILGKNSPVISDGIWDRVELLVTIRRDSGHDRRLGWVADLAVRAANPQGGAGDTPREVWTKVALEPGEMEKTFTVPFPPLVAGENVVTLLTYDNTGRILEWLGPGQNPTYLAAYAPLVAQQAAVRLNQAQQVLGLIHQRLGLPAGARVSESAIATALTAVDQPAMGIADPLSVWELAIAQEALAINPVALAARGRAEVMVWHRVEPAPGAQFEQQVADLKHRGVTAIALQIPDLEQKLLHLIRVTDLGVGAATDPFRQEAWSRAAAEASRIAHRHGLTVHLALRAQPVFEELARRGAAKDTLADFTRLVVEVSEQGGWNLDTYAFRDATEPQRRELERTVRGGFNVATTFMGSKGASSSQSVFLTVVPVGTPAEQAQAAQRIEAEASRAAAEVIPQGRFATGVVVEGPSLAAVQQWLSDPALPTVGTDDGVRRQFLAHLRGVEANTLRRLGYAPAVIAQARTKAAAVTQKEFTAALAVRDITGAVEPWAQALVQGVTARLRAAAEVQQVERYGTAFERALLWFYGIHVTPSIITEAQRVEVTPLSPRRIVQTNGTAVVGVRVTNPANPAVAKAPAVYDVWVHLDYPSWQSRPAGVHRAGKLILAPGQQTEVWVELQGLPTTEESRLVKIRVLPRGAEPFLAGQVSTRSTEEQALEFSTFVIQGAQGSRRPSDDALRDLRREIEQGFSTWASNWRVVHGVDKDDLAYPKLLQQQVNAYLAVGTPVQRVAAPPQVQCDPATGSVTVTSVTPLPVSMETAATTAAGARQAAQAAPPTSLAQVQPAPERRGDRFLTGLYETGATGGLVGGLLLVFGRWLRLYRRAREARRHYEAVESLATPPPGPVTQAYDLRRAQAIRTRYSDAGYVAEPAALHPEHRKVIDAATALGTRVGVLNPEIETLSQNIERTLVDPFHPQRPGEPLPPRAVLAEAERAQFQRAAPALMGWNGVGILGAAAAALAAGTPLGWVVGGAAALGVASWALWRWVAPRPAVQYAGGRLLTIPAWIVASGPANHPVTTSLVGAGVLAGAGAAALALGLPLWPVAAGSLVWAVIAAAIARPTPARLLGTWGLAALGTVGLGWALTLPPLGWMAASAATLVATYQWQKAWLTTPRPVEGLLHQVWTTTRFAVKWGMVTAAAYGLVGIVHPALWTGVIKLPMVGVLGAWAGLKALPVAWGAGIVGGVLGLNLVHQCMAYWVTHRDLWSVGFTGVALPGLFVAGGAVAFGLQATLAGLSYVAIGGLAAQLGSIALLGAAWSRTALRRWVEAAGLEERAAPEARPLENPDPDLYRHAKAAAARDHALQRQYDIEEPFDRPDEALTRQHWMLINRHYWRLVAIRQARAMPGFARLSKPDQALLINVFWTQLYNGHARTVIGEDAGTSLRTFLHGLWTGRMSEVVQALEDEDRLVVIMPALILSVCATKGEAWARMTRSKWYWHLAFWEAVRQTLVSFAVPLGFFASTGANRPGRAFLTAGANADFTLRVRGDAGLPGYKDPVDYVLKVMGRWLDGHVFVVMRGYLGHRVSRAVEDLLLAHRWRRKDPSVHAHIRRLMDEADAAWGRGDRVAFAQRMDAAIYASLTGGKNRFFALGHGEGPSGFEAVEWNTVPDEDGIKDPRYYGPEFNRGLLPGTIGMRLDLPRRDGFHVFYPTKVVWSDAARDWVLSQDPGKFLIRMPHARQQKGRLLDAFYQYLEGRHVPEPVIRAGLEERSLEVRFASVEDQAVPELREARAAVENPHDRYEGLQRAAGEAASQLMVQRTHERTLGAPLGSAADTTEVLQGTLGYEGFGDPAGLLYQWRMNLFGWLQEQYLGLDHNLQPAPWRHWAAWGATVAVGASIGWLTGSWPWAIAAIVAPRLAARLWGTPFALSFIGLGIQDTILQGMKAHYDGAFLTRAMDGFFEGTPAASRAGVTAAGYRALLRHGWALMVADPTLRLLVEAYPRAMHPEDEHWKNKPYSRQRADPALVRLVRPVLPDAPTTRWKLRKAIKEAILARVRRMPPADQQAFREAFTRYSQLELAAVGNKVAGIQYHRSHDRDVFRAGDVNAQFTVDGQAPLLRLMTGLGVPARTDRTWAAYSEGVLYGVVRMPSMLYSPTDDPEIGRVLDQARQGGFVVEAIWRTGDELHAVIRHEAVVGDPRFSTHPERTPSEELNKERKDYLEAAEQVLGIARTRITLTPLGELDRVDIPAGAVRRINPLEAYLQGGGDLTVNQFTLRHTHGQPDLEAVTAFLREESRLMAARLPTDVTAEMVDRLPSPEDRPWLEERWSRVRASLVREGEVRLSAARPFPEVWARRLSAVRHWAIAVTGIAGFLIPPLRLPLWLMTTAAWALGLSPVRTGLTALWRWAQPGYWRRLLQTGNLVQEPYSEEAVVLNVLYGATPDQIIRDRRGRIVDLRRSALDGLYDASRWDVAIGTYFVPGTPIGRLPVWERGGLMVHAPPVPLVAALRLLEERPDLAPASGFSGWLPTDALELGAAFAEDTKGGSVSLHRPALNPFFNALNIQKLLYLFGQAELRQGDEGLIRAIQLFKGLGIIQAVEHLFDHPMLAQYRQTSDAAMLQEIMRSVFGMEAFRRDEVATAGAHGAGTLSYGYTGFTASDLFGRRVGPFAPGDVAAYWKARTYLVADGLTGGLIGLALRELQGLPAADRSPDALLQGDPQDPDVAVAVANRWIQEHLRYDPDRPDRPEAIRRARAAHGLPPAAGMEEGPEDARHPAEVSTTVTVVPAEPVATPAPASAGPAVVPRLLPVRFSDTAWTPAVRQAAPEVAAVVAAPPPAVVTAPPQAHAQMALDVMAAGLRLTEQDTVTVAAVPASVVVQANPGLASLAGQLITLGSARLALVPDDPAAASGLVVSLMSETARRVVIQPYGGLEETALDVLEAQAARVGFEVQPRRPLTGTTLGDILRQILANLSGLEESAVPELSVRELVEALTLRALA